MKNVYLFLTGLLFGLGLIVSGMINPAKVIGFLDLFGQWDPSLAFVMAGAVLVTTIGYRYASKVYETPMFDLKFRLPSRTDIDKPLIQGAVLFGLGWGLVGLCPGPAIAAITAAPSSAIIFGIAMLVGMFAARKFSAAN